MLFIQDFQALIFTSFPKIIYKLFTRKYGVNIYSTRYNYKSMEVLWLPAISAFPTTLSVIYQNQGILGQQKELYEYLRPENTTKSLGFLTPWTSMWWNLNDHICLRNIYRVITYLHNIIRKSWITTVMSIKKVVAKIITCNDPHSIKQYAYAPNQPSDIIYRDLQIMGKQGPRLNNYPNPWLLPTEHLI